MSRIFEDFQNSIEALDAANVAALDGGKAAKEGLASAREAVIEHYKYFAAYVIKAAAGDMEKITSTNLPVITPKPPTPPAESVNPPVIRDIFRGARPGEISFFIKAVAGAHGYKGRRRVVFPTLGDWTEFAIPKVKSAITVSALTSGCRYAFEVCALGNTRYSDWSDSATMMCP